MHAIVIWTLRIHIKISYYGCCKLALPKSALNLYSHCIPFHPICKSYVLAWDPSSHLLQSPFYFLLLRYQNLTHNSGLNPLCREKFLIVQDLAMEGASPVGKTMTETCGLPSCLLRFSFLKGTPFLRMVFSKCGCQARLLASLKNLLKWKLLAPTQSC